MELLPLELEEIILDYKNQFEITDKYQKCLDEINKIIYYITITENGKRIRSRRYEPYYHNFTTYVLEYSENVTMTATEEFSWHFFFGRNSFL